MGLLSASAFVAVPAIAESSNPTPPGHDRVVLCASGVETDGDIQISAATVTRVVDGDTTPLPEGCQAG